MKELTGLEEALAKAIGGSKGPEWLLMSPKQLFELDPNAVFDLDEIEPDQYLCVVGDKYTSYTFDGAWNRIKENK